MKTSFALHNQVNLPKKNVGFKGLFTPDYLKGQAENAKGSQKQLYVKAGDQQAHGQDATKTLDTGDFMGDIAQSLAHGIPAETRAGRIVDFVVSPLQLPLVVPIAACGAAKSLSDGLPASNVARLALKPFAAAAAPLEKVGLNRAQQKTLDGQRKQGSVDGKAQLSLASQKILQGTTALITAGAIAAGTGNMINGTPFAPALLNNTVDAVELAGKGVAAPAELLWDSGEGLYNITAGTLTNDQAQVDAGAKKLIDDVVMTGGRIGSYESEVAKSYGNTGLGVLKTGGRAILDTVETLLNVGQSKIDNAQAPGTNVAPASTPAASRLGTLTQAKTRAIGSNSKAGEPVISADSGIITVRPATVIANQNFGAPNGNAVVLAVPGNDAAIFSDFTAEPIVNEANGTVTIMPQQGQNLDSVTASTNYNSQTLRPQTQGKATQLF